MRFIHTVDKNGLINGADIHLFSGSSKLGTFRIDINQKSNATHILSVQKILKFLIERNIKFDLILLDPPYNSTYGKKYKTHNLNKIDNGSHFLKWLVRRCKKFLNPFGLLISKNWRSIKPKYCKFVCGVLSKYGGFRRNTVLEVWQYFPTYDKSKVFNFLFFFLSFFTPTPILLRFFQCNFYILIKKNNILFLWRREIIVKNLIS